MYEFKLKVFSVIIFLQNVICGCHNDRKQVDFDWSKSGYKSTRAFRLPDVVDECSGGIAYTDSTFLTHNDDGEPCLYEVDYQGNMKRTYCVPGATNHDWEDIAKDDSGNIYACNVGNNWNNRKNLTIYKYHIGQVEPAALIKLSYSDQTDFAPEESKRNFDCEAVFWRNDSLYLVSKNRGEKTVKIYGLPDVPGTYVAHPVAFKFIPRMITGADISPDGDKLALLAYGAVYLFDIGQIANSHQFFNRPVACLRFPKSGQSEAIWFKTDSTFYVANEGNHVFYFQTNKFGRKKIRNEKPRH